MAGVCRLVLVFFWISSFGGAKWRICSISLDIILKMVRVVGLLEFCIG